MSISNSAQQIQRKNYCLCNVHYLVEALADFHSKPVGNDQSLQFDIFLSSGLCRDLLICIYNGWDRRASQLLVQSYRIDGDCPRVHPLQMIKLIIFHWTHWKPLFSTHLVLDRESCREPVCSLELVHLIQLNWIYLECNPHPPEISTIIHTTLLLTIPSTYLTEELISTESTEPCNPGYLLRAAHFSANQAEQTFVEID